MSEFIDSVLHRNGIKQTNTAIENKTGTCSPEEQVKAITRVRACVQDAESNERLFRNLNKKDEKGNPMVSPSEIKDFITKAKNIQGTAGGYEIGSVTKLDNFQKSDGTLSDSVRFGEQIKLINERTGAFMIIDARWRVIQYHSADREDPNNYIVSTGVR